jgi:hypothetical protein
MFKAIITAAVGFGVIMTVAAVVSQPASTANLIRPNITIVKKKYGVSIKDYMTIDSCRISECADV